MVTLQVIRSYHSLTVGRSIDWIEVSLMLPPFVPLDQAQPWEGVGRVRSCEGQPSAGAQRAAEWTGLRSTSRLIITSPRRGITSAPLTYH
jgi:hypothetical protein